MEAGPLLAAMQALTDRIARKVGEGYDRPNADSELPIDINYARLAEWLVREECRPRRRLAATGWKKFALEKTLFVLRWPAACCLPAANAWRGPPKAPACCARCAGGPQASPCRLDQEAAGHPGQGGHGTEGAAAGLPGPV